MFNECFLLFQLALMIDLFVFSYIHAFVLSSYVSERVLARADMCMFAKWMLFFVPSSHGYSILTAIKLIYEHTTDPRDMLCACKFVCVFMLNECCFLFHLALMMDFCLFSYMHAFVHSSYLSERVLAWADVCMFAEWMLFHVPSNPDYSTLTEIKLIYECTNGPTRHVACF